MNLGTRDLEILTVLAREQHMGRAAETLGLRQPQLSIRLAQIERVLGLKLFERRPRVIPTPEGELIVEAARAAFSDFAAATERAKRMAGGHVGSIVIGLAASVILSDVPLSVQRFRAAYPRVDLALRDMHSSLQGDALRRGLIDVAVTREPVSGGTLAAEILGRQRFVALLPAGHRLARRGWIALAELADEPFVLFHPGIAPGLLEQVNALCLRAGFTPRVVQQAQEWYTVLGFVRAGIGVTITLDVFAGTRAGSVVTCALEDAEATSPVFLGWDAARMSGPCELLLDWLRADRGVLAVTE